MINGFFGGCLLEEHPSNRDYDMLTCSGLAEKANKIEEENKNNNSNDIDIFCISSFNAVVCSPVLILFATSIASFRSHTEKHFWGK